MELAFDRAERPDLYEPVLAEYRETETDARAEEGTSSSSISD